MGHRYEPEKLETAARILIVDDHEDNVELLRARLESWGYELARWRRRNLFFGGVAGVEFREEGTLAAAGDPRRGGHGVVTGGLSSGPSSA